MFLLLSGSPSPCWDAAVCLYACLPAEFITYAATHTHTHTRTQSNIFGGPSNFISDWKLRRLHLHLETYLIHWWRPLSWCTLSSRRHMAQYFNSVLLLPLLAYQTCMYIIHTHTHIFCVKVFVCFFFILSLFSFCFALPANAGFIFSLPFTRNCCYIYYIIYINIKYIYILHIDSSSRLTSVCVLFWLPFVLLSVCGLHSRRRQQQRQRWAKCSNSNSSSDSDSDVDGDVGALQLLEPALLFLFGNLLLALRFVCCCMCVVACVCVASELVCVCSLCFAWACWQ